MGATTKQANFLLPEDLLEELKKVVPRREQSKIVVEALKKELKRLRLQKALQTSFAIWKDTNHPELKAGTEAYIRKLRKSTRSKAFIKNAVLATSNEKHYPMKDIVKVVAT